MKRLVAILSVAATILSVTGVGVAQAVPPSSSTTILDSLAQPAANAAAGDVLTSVTDAPVVTTGTSNSSVTQTFNVGATHVKAKNVIDSNGQTVQVPDITAPEGFTLTYSDGTTWSSNVPSYDSQSGTYPTLAGVRATGSLTTTGYSDGLEQVSRSAVAIAEAGTTFQGTSGGDGWDVFFGSGPAAGRVFNIFHHSGGDFTMDCHLRDGTPCWSALYRSNSESTPPATYFTSAHSTGYYIAATDSVWSFVADGAGRLGMVCATAVSTDTPVPCETPFVALTGDVGASISWSGNGAADALLIGTDIYARGFGTGSDLLCFDTLTATPCAGEPFSLGQPTGNSSFGDNRLLAVGTNVYYSTGNFLGCFDSVTKALCAGFNGGAALNVEDGNGGSVSMGPLFYSTDVNGEPTQVCVYNEASCWALDGSAGTWPVDLPQGDYSSATDGWGVDLNVGTKFYYISGQSGAGCYDFVTSAACAGFSSPSLGWYAYTIRTDPANDWCLWSNSDQGQIVTFSPTTGASPCSPPRPAVIVPYTQAVPRLSCDEAGRVVAWGSLTITPPQGAAMDQVRVTVQDSGGTPIDGWSSLTPDQSGFIDLSSLTLQQTGLRPTYEVQFADNTDPTGTVGTFTYSAKGPQLCVDLVVQAYNCPTGVGGGSGAFPIDIAQISSASEVSVATDSAAAVVENTSASATRANNALSLQAADCLAWTDGYVYRHRGGSDPVAGIEVQLLGPDDAQVATAVTDSNGYYTFDALYNNTYYVAANGLSTRSTAVAHLAEGLTTFPELVLPNSLPRVAQVPATVPEGTTREVLQTQGLPVSTLAVSGHCAVVDGTSVHFTTPGSCIITVTQGSTVIQTIDVTVTAINNLALSAPPTTMPPGTGWRVITRQGAPSATVTVTGPCKTKSARVYFGYAGTCRITVKQGGAVVHTYSTSVVAGAATPAGSISMHHLSVYFEPGSPVLMPAAIAKLVRVAASMSAAKTVLVVGYTTATSGGPSGQASATLSKARAQSVADYLTAHGVRVTLKAGLSRLGNPGIGAATNRRVDLAWV